MSKEKKIEAYVEEVWPDVVKDIGRLVAVDSVENLDYAHAEAPYGPGPAAALETGCRIGERLGLDFTNDHGYIAFGDLPGESDEQIALLCHLDVVPAGDGWQSDPFKLKRKDGYLVGRGVLDDKGPAVLALYTAHYFVRKVSKEGKRLPFTLRVMLGANEESGFRDVDYYTDHYDDPMFLITPDSFWPVCVGEKGIATAYITSPAIDNGRIVEFSGGEAHNVIPSTATAIVMADWHDLPEVRGIDIIDDGDGKVRLLARGKGGHAARPEGSRNAIGMLVDYLLEQGICNEQEREFLELEKVIFSDNYGKALDIDATDDLFDPLTCIGGTIRQRDGKFEQTLNIRFPKSISSEELDRRLHKVVASYHCDVHVDIEDEPYWIDPNAPEIECLRKVYEEHTDESGEPFTMGGGTYARHFKRAASFGPEPLDNQLPPWAGEVHTPNEAISEDSLKQALAIYIDAIGRLMQLDWD